jgi:hypothetical protein
LECKSGPPSLLDRVAKKAGHHKSLEDTIHSMMMARTRRGFPYKKRHLFNLVKNLLETLKIPNPFPEGTPSRYSYSGMLKRFPEMAAKMSECDALPKTVREWEIAIRKWFQNISVAFFNESIVELVAEEPARVLSCALIKFKICDDKGKLVLDAVRVH